MPPFNVGTKAKLIRKELAVNNKLDVFHSELKTSGNKL